MLNRWSFISRRFTFGSALIPMIFSLAVLVAWSMGRATIPRIIEGLPLMVPNVAISLFLISFALLVLWRGPYTKLKSALNALIALTVLFVATIALVEFYTGKSYAIDRLLVESFISQEFMQEIGQTMSPAPNSGIGLFLLGLSLLLFHKRIIIAQVFALLVFSVATLALTGQAYRISQLYHFPGTYYSMGMPLPTALALISLSLNIIARSPEEGILKYFVKDSLAAEILRRFALAMFFVPLLFGAAALIGAGKNIQELLIVLTGVSIVMLTGFSIVTISSAMAINKLEKIRDEAEKQLIDKEKALAESQRIAQMGSWEWLLKENKLTWSDEVYRLFGLPVTSSPITYEAFLTMIHPDDRKLVNEAVNLALEGKAPYSIDHRILLFNGELLYVHEEGVVNFAEDGSAVRMMGTIHNITQRKLAEEALQQKERLLTQVIEVLPVGVWLMDKDGNIYSGNKASQRIWTGAKFVDPESFGEYKGWWEETGKEIKAEDWAAYRAIKYGQTSLGELVRIQCFDGSTKVILNSAVPLRNPDGAIAGAIIVNEDITERRQAQLDAEEAANRVKAFLENANDSVLTADSKGNIIFVNRQVEIWFGYSKEELLNQKIEMLIPERFRENHVVQRNSYFAAPVARGMGLGREIFARRKDGREFPVEITLSPVKSKGEYFVTAVIRDVTDRKKYENQQHFLNHVSQELVESIDFETTLKSTVECAVPELGDWCMVHILATQKNPELRIAKHADPKQQALLEKALALQSLNERAEFGIIKAIRSGRTILVSSLTNETKNKTFTNREAREAFEKLLIRSYIIVPLKTHGEILGALTIAQGYSGRNISYEDRPLVEDLAQRVAYALENARLYSEALSAVRSREDVLFIVSHDLKNPLSAIQLSTQYLNRKLKELPDNSAMLKMVGSISGAANSMNSLIHSILDIGKIQAGTFTIEPKETDLGTLLKSVEDLFIPLAKEKNINLLFSPEEINFKIVCDPDRVVQIFSNLIGNALKFTPDGGTVIVSTQFSNKELLVCVEDNGPGMTPNFISHIFDRYWQAKETSAKGSGLGLFITKGIVDAHGGKIWVESAPEKGSRFYFTLPEVAVNLGAKYQHRENEVTGSVDHELLQ